MRQLASKTLTTNAAKAEQQATTTVLTQALLRGRSPRPGDRFGSMRDFSGRIDRSSSADLRRFERSASARLDMAQLIDGIVTSEGITAPGGFDATRAAPSASVFYGAAGVALALAELAARCGRPEWLTIGRAWAETAARSSDADAFYNEAFFGPQQQPDVRSFHHGPAGAHITVATCAALQGDRSGMARAVDDVARVVATGIQQAAETDTTIDSMVGPVSLLTGVCGLVELIEATPDGPDDGIAADRQIERCVLAVLKRLIADGLERLDTSIVARSIHGHAPSNLGAAHGWAGLLDAVMRSATAIGIEAPGWVADRADELSSFVEVRDGKAFWPVAAGHPIAASGGWCNGSAGHVSMWCRRYAVSGDDRHLDLARFAATAAASEPSPVHNLCCGSSGKVLAALTLFRTTGEDHWLEEAETFLREADRLRGVQSPPMHELARVPRSVYKGDLGVAVAAAALIDPERPVRFFH